MKTLNFDGCGVLHFFISPVSLLPEKFCVHHCKGVMQNVSVVKYFLNSNIKIIFNIGF